MRASQSYLKTSKSAPADEVAKNAQLLIRAGYVHKVMAGVYAFTPLGIRVLENIKTIVRNEMNALGAEELIMSSLQSRETWETTGRWDESVVDIWFKSKLQDGTEVGFGWSHEEPIIEMLKQHISSYKDLPVNVYQFQTKLRNEVRAKSGIMRGREFVMKDMYSCSVDAEQHEAFYQSVIEAYNRVFAQVGLGDETYVTYASGGAFTEFSHEFQTICEAGEDIIYLHRGKNIAVNEEVMTDENLAKLGIKREEMEAVKSAEVGNIFNFGIDKSETMDFAFTNEKGEEQFIHLGSYGIGVTRLMGVLAEKHSDERGLVWADNVAPYRVYLARVGEDKEVTEASDKLYEELQAADISVYYDDRDARAGEKFADADLIGLPHRVIVSNKTVASGKHEYKGRTNSQANMIETSELMQKLGVTAV